MEVYRVEEIRRDTDESLPKVSANVVEMGEGGSNVFVLLNLVWKLAFRNWGDVDC